MSCACPVHPCSRQRRKGRRVCSWCAQVCPKAPKGPPKVIGVVLINGRTGPLKLA